VPRAQRGEETTTSKPLCQRSWLSGCWMAVRVKGMPCLDRLRWLDPTAFRRAVASEGVEKLGDGFQGCHPERKPEQSDGAQLYKTEILRLRCATAHLACATQDSSPGLAGADRMTMAVFQYPLAGPICAGLDPVVE